MEDLDMTALGRDSKRLSDDVSSRVEQRSPHHKTTTSPNSMLSNSHSTPPSLVSGAYSHPPPPTQPPPLPPSVALKASGKSRSQQQQQQPMTSQGDPLHASRGHMQDRLRDTTAQGTSRKEEGGPPYLKTTKLLGSDIYHGHQGASRGGIAVPPHPWGGGTHEERHRKSSSPDHDSWHTSSDTYLPPLGSEQSDIGGLSQSYSPQLPHRFHDNQLQASNSDTKLTLAAGRPRGGVGEVPGAEPSKLADGKATVNTKGEVATRGQRSSKGDYVFTRVVNRSEGAGLPAGGGALLQKPGQSSSQPSPSLLNQSNQPTTLQGLPAQSLQSNLPSQPSQSSPQQEVTGDHLNVDDDQSRPHPKVASPKSNGGVSSDAPPPPQDTAAERGPVTSAPPSLTNLHDATSASSSSEELSKFCEDREDMPPAMARPMANAPANYPHHRGIPLTSSQYQHHSHSTYTAQGAAVNARVQDMPPPIPLPQTRPAPSQQYEKIIFNAEVHHRGQGPKVAHDYPPVQDDHYHHYPLGPPGGPESFAGPQGMQGPPPTTGGGGYKGQSRLVRVDPSQMVSKTKVAIAHDAAIKGDMATLRYLLTSHEIDPVCTDDNGSSLIHRAAQNGHVAILRMLCADLSPVHLQTADGNYDTPAMLAIQGGHVDCLQYLVQEGGVPLEVKDAGGETLVHHAAYHGQHRCLELLLKLLKTVQKSDQPTEILDDSGVTPAHFAAQRGHLECLQLLMNYGYSVNLPDREGQKPSDWADTMGQAICTRYLVMVETSWALSSEVSWLVEQVHILRKQNEQLKELLKLQEHEHRANVGKMQQEHDLKVTKMKEQYIDLTTSLLKDIGQNAKPTSVDQKDMARPQQANHGKKGDAPQKGKQSLGPEGALKRKPLRPAPVAERPPQTQPRDSTEVELALDDVDYRATTPQEVLRRQMTSVEQRMNASREIRRRQSVMADGKSADRPPNKSQHHTTEQPERRPTKVKFAANVTEINASPERQGVSKQQAATTTSPLHTPTAVGTKDPTSDSGCATNGSDARSLPSEPSHSKKS